MSDVLISLDERIEEAKRVALMLAEEKRLLLRSSNLDLFVPNPGGQSKFFEESDCKQRSVFSGNRFGKSTAGVVEDCCWLLGYRPFYEEGNPLRYKGIPTHGVKGLVIASTWDKVREIFTEEGDPAVDDRMGKFFEFLPKDVISKKTRNQHGAIGKIEVTSTLHGRERKSILIFDTVRSFVTNPQGKESSDWDFIHVDEPIPKEMWDAVSRGLLDRNGKSWWLMTPLIEPWMYHYAEETFLADPENNWLYNGDTDENLTLSQEAKDVYFGQLSEDDKACRKAGKPVALSRLVIGNYDEERHLLRGTPRGWANPLTPPVDYTVVAATDTHPQTPHATLKVAISPLGEVFIYSERFKKGAIQGPDSIADYILNCPEIDQLYYYLLEPAAWNEDQTTGRRYVDDFFEAGLQPERGSKKRTEIIILMNALFGDPNRKVYVLEHCRVFRHEILRWYFNKDDKPMDKDDHIMECFGRLLAHDNFRYHRPYESSPVLSKVNYALNSPISSGSYADNLHLNAV